MLPSNDNHQSEELKSVLCSIRLTNKEKTHISSVSKGLTASIKYLYDFFLRWKNIELQLKTNIKILCLEFSQTTMLFLKYKDEQKISEVNQYYQLMITQGQLIKRLFDLLPDPKQEYLLELFNDKKYLEYLKFIWAKHCP